MLKIFQSFLETTANFLIGDHLTKQEESYDSILDTFGGEEETNIASAPSSEKIHQQHHRQMRQTKKEFFSRALQGGIASLYLVPTTKGVVVPEQFMGAPELVLNYSYRYHIADFNFDDERVVASLSFGGFPFQCVVPWDAVFGIGNQAEGAYCSFVQDSHPIEKNTPLQAHTNSKTPVFEQISHEKAIDRRKQFKVIKGNKQ